MLGLSCMYSGGIMYYILKEHNRIPLKGYEYVVHLSQIWMHNGLCGMCLRNFCMWIFVVKIDGLRILTKFKCLGPVWVRHTKCPLLLELLQQSHKSYSQYKSLKGGGGGVKNLNTVQTLLEIDFLVRTHAAAGQLCSTSSLFRVLLLVFSIDFQNLGLKNKFVGLWLLLQDSYQSVGSLGTSVYS